MPIPDAIPQGPATGWGIGEYLEKNRQLPDLGEMLKNSPAERDPELEEELKKDHQTQQSK